MSKWLMAGLALVVGGLQAWDSGVLEAEGAVQALVAAGVLLPPAVFAASRNTARRGAAVVAAAALLVAARLVSSVQLPELVLAAFFAGILVWFDHMRALRAAAPSGTSAAPSAK